MNKLQGILQIDAASNTDVIAAMETNFYSHACYIAKRLKTIEVVENDYLITISTGFVGRTMFLDDEIRIKNVIDLIKRYFNAVDFSWYITPCTKPDNLASLLHKYGFHLTKAEPVMTFNLKNGSMEEPSTKGLLLSLADSLVSLDQFDQVYAEIWNPQGRQYFMNAKDILLQKDCPLELYVVYAQGQPIAIYELFFEAGIVGIYSVGVVPKMRQQGLASSFLSMLLLDLARRGYEIAMLHSTPAAFNIYKHLGFIEVCTFYEYKLSAIT
jgi:ribosomal protein S18 acetylase RimI-like enzyme